MTNAQKLLMIGGAPWLTRRDYPKLVGGLEAWFDETDPSSMIMDSANRVSLIADKSGNSSTNVLCLNGVAGNYASAPDSAALSITGDITLIAQAMLTDWTPGTAMCLVGKEVGDPQRSYWMEIDTAGTISISWTTTGSIASALTMTSTVAITVTDLASKWVQATLDVDNGSGSRVAKFYVSDDGVTWVQLGTTVTTAGATSIADTTAVLSVGARGSGGGQRMVTGNIMRARILNGYDGAGSVVFDANFSLPAKLAPSFTESSSNAATVTINTSGATGARISGARDLYQGTAANQPIYLPWSGANYGYLNGVAGNYASAPDSAALSITGDIDLRAQVALDDWTPASPMQLIAKDESGQRSYTFTVQATTGNLVVGYSTDGVNLVEMVSSAAPTVSDFGILWVRATLDVDNGAAGKTATFYTSSDGSTWTQLGTPQTTAGTIAIANTTSVLQLGANFLTSNRLTGRIYRAQIYNGIAGTLAFDFNPAAYSSGTTFLDSSSNAATITINGGANIVTSTRLYFDGSNGYLKAAAFALAQPETVYFVGSQVTWTSNDKIYDGNSATERMALLQYTGGATPQIGMFAGTTPTAGPYSTWAVATNAVITALFSGANGLFRVNRGTASAASVNTQSANGFTLGAALDGTFPANITASEVLVYSGAHDTATQDRVICYLARKHRLPAV